MLNRPEQRNPLSGQMLRDLGAAFAWCKQDPEVRVVVLTGAGDRVFCAGADLSSFDAGMSALDRHRGRERFVELFTLMAGLGKPIVGRINGHALAGGPRPGGAVGPAGAHDTPPLGPPRVK